MRSLKTPLSLVLAGAGLAAAVPATAQAADRFYVYGRGYGHGVGMSQYGAYGYAQHGWTYDEILGHYYQGTDLSAADPSIRVRVLLGTERGRVRVTHASSAGARKLNARANYTLVPSSGNRVTLLRGSRRVARFASGVTFRGPKNSVRLRDRTMNGVLGGFRGGLRVERGAGGLRIVNVLGVDAYVQGVVAGEMPSSWAPEALKAQATAARSYALTSGAGTRELYPDTRSQVYSGMSGETPTTNAAVKATRGKIVTYRGDPVTTFFFSTSGGITENVENVFGGSPAPYLRSVKDEYDSISPRHRWKFVFTPSSIGRRLGVGRLVRVDRVRRGESPRIIRARVVGTARSRVLTGSSLRARLGTYDSWMRFKRITTTASSARRSQPTALRAMSTSLWASHPRASRQLLLVGSVVPAKRGGKLAVQRRAGQRWVRAGTTRVGRGGRFRWAAPRAGTYRVVAGGGLAGPAVRVK